MMDPREPYRHNRPICDECRLEATAFMTVSNTHPYFTWREYDGKRRCYRCMQWHALWMLRQAEFEVLRLRRENEQLRRPSLVARARSVVGRIALSFLTLTSGWPRRLDYIPSRQEITNGDQIRSTEAR